MSTPELATPVAHPPSTLAVDPSAAIPLADWASLALRAGRVGPNLPNMGWLLRFPDDIPRAALEVEARRLAATPYGFGRRIVSPRLPAGRPRWTPAPEPPAVVLAETPACGPAGLAAWLDRQLAVPLDPEYDSGWRIAATPTDDGGTAVLVCCHHLFGTGRGVLGALYGTDDDPTTGTTETPFTSESTFTARDEARGIGERLRLGLRGVAQRPSRPRAAGRSHGAEVAPWPRSQPSADLDLARRRHRIIPRLGLGRRRRAAGRQR
jgi:hypothetical protein